MSEEVKIGGPVVCQQCGQLYNCSRDIHICIPDDLRAQYMHLEHQMLGSRAQERQARPIAALIERIARLEVEVKQLRTASTKEQP